MTSTTISHQEFKRDANKAQQAAQHGPVFITDHGRPAHVLLTIQEYQRLTAYQTNIVEWLAMPDNADWEFEPPRLHGPLYLRADLY